MAKSKFRPLHDRVVVKRIDAEEKTKGGIIIPDTAKEKPIEGKVVAVGNGKVTKDGKVLPLDVKVGDVVVYSKYGGTEITVEGDDLLILNARDVLAIVTTDKKKK